LLLRVAVVEGVPHPLGAGLGAYSRQRVPQGFLGPPREEVAVSLQRVALGAQAQELAAAALWLVRALGQRVQLGVRGVQEDVAPPPLW